MWAVWLAGLLLAYPVNLWNERQNRPLEVFADMVEELDTSVGVCSGFLAAYAILVAVAVFFHLFKSPAANFVGALPIRREGVFATAFAAGYTMILGPMAVTALVTLLVEWAAGAVAAGPLFSWLGLCALLAFFWFSFASLCCVITGNGVGAVSFYVIFNGVVPVMTWLIQMLLESFLYGFDGFVDEVWQAVSWFFPLGLTTMGIDFGGMALVGSYGEMCAIYAAVGFLMLLAALGLHHIRKTERAGDLIAFRYLRYAFKFCVILCGGLSLGMLLSELLFFHDAISLGLRLAICCALAAAICAFVAEMLLRKTLKVFRTGWKSALIGAVAFVVAIFAVDMDWIGFTTRVPRADHVELATAEFHGPELDGVAGEVLLYEGSEAEPLLALHQSLVDDRKSWENGEYGEYGRVILRYDLGLTHMSRTYTCYYRPGSAQEEILAAAVTAGRPQFDVELDTPAGVYVNLEAGEKSNGEWAYYSAALESAERQAVWEAIREDVTAGRYRAAAPGEMEGRDQLSFELEWTVPLKDRPGTRVTKHQRFYLRPGSTATQAAAERLGLTDPEVMEARQDGTYTGSAVSTAPAG